MITPRYLRFHYHYITSPFTKYPIHFYAFLNSAQHQASLFNSLGSIGVIKLIIHQSCLPSTPSEHPTWQDEINTQLHAIFHQHHIEISQLKFPKKGQKKTATSSVTLIQVINISLLLSALVTSMIYPAKDAQIQEQQRQLTRYKQILIDTHAFLNQPRNDEIIQQFQALTQLPQTISHLTLRENCIDLNSQLSNANLSKLAPIFARITPPNIHVQVTEHNEHTIQINSTCAN